VSSDARQTDPGVLSLLGQAALSQHGRTVQVAGLAGRLLVALGGTDTPQPIDRLIHAAWGDDPPPSARAALHVHLGTLRRHLAAQSDGPAVERTPAGYCLRLNGWERDIDVAGRAAASARSSLHDDPEQALQDVRHALRLWRGQPFSVSGETVDLVAATRATALRHELEELEVEVLLTLGCHAEAEQVGIALVDAEPFREVRWAQLMRARFLDGRSGEALRTYQDARRALIDGLGIEPGALLRELERSVLLRDDDAVRTSVVRAAELPGPPPAPHLLIGRDRELDRCLATMAGGRVAIVHGPPGIGKSAFAAEVARRFAPGATAWIDPRSDVRTIDELTSGPGPSWLRADVLALLVIDDADQMPDATAAIRSVLRRAQPSLPILITSRVRDVDHDAVFTGLEPLAVPDLFDRGDVLSAVPSARLLRAAMADLDAGLQLTDPDVVLLCRASGGLPLALRLAAAATVGAPAEQVVEAVRSGLAASIATTLQRLEPDERTTFRCCALIGHAFDAEMAAAVADIPVADTARILRTLADHGLVQRGSGATLPYALLTPIRDVAEHMLLEANEASTARKRLSAWALARSRSLAINAVSAERPTTDATSAALTPTFQAVLDHLADSGDSAQALMLARRLDAPLYLAGLWSQRRRIIERALAVPGPPSRDRAVLLGLSARNGPLSTMDATRLDQAVEAARATGDDVVLATSRHLRAIGLWWRGEHADALAEQRWAAAVLEAHGHPVATEARKYEAVVRVHAGWHDEGIRALSEIAERYRRQDRSALEGHTLAYLGHCQRFVGDPDAATADWRRSLELLLAAGNHASSIHVLLGLAGVAVERGDRDRCLALVAQSLAAIDRTSLHEYSTWAWSLAIRALLDADRIEEAAAGARAALARAPHVTRGEVSRLAVELSQLAARLGSPRHAARLVGCVLAHDGPFELPLPAPTERERADAIVAAVAGSAVPSRLRDLDAGRRCTLREAAGDIFDEQRPPCA
jgi:DNA-binding SARP family transcriptional activator/tetratricopeptide (TPR) repeat protein